MGAAVKLPPADRMAVDSEVIIDLSVTVAADSAKTFRVVTDHQSFPRFTGDKLITSYVPLDGGASRWDIDVDGCPIYWVQRTIVSVANREVRFSRIEGDFEMWEGAFRVAETGDGTKLSLVFRCAWGVPVLDERIKPTLQEKMGLFAQKLLAALKAAAEAA